MVDTGEHGERKAEEIAVDINQCRLFK